MYFFLPIPMVCYNFLRTKLFLQKLKKCKNLKLLSLCFVMIFQLSNNSSSKLKWPLFFLNIWIWVKTNFPRRINYGKTVNVDIFSCFLINSYEISKTNLMMRAFYLQNWFSKYSIRSSIKPMVWWLCMQIANYSWKWF